MQQLLGTREQLMFNQVLDLKMSRSYEAIMGLVIVIEVQTYLTSC